MKPVYELQYWLPESKRFTLSITRGSRTYLIDCAKRFNRDNPEMKYRVVKKINGKVVEVIHPKKEKKR